MLDAAEAHTSGYGATHEGEGERTPCVKTDKQDQENEDEAEQEGEEEEEHHLVLPLPLLEQSPIEKQPRRTATIALQSPSTPAFTPFTPNG